MLPVLLVSLVLPALLVPLVLLLMLVSLVLPVEVERPWCDAAGDASGTLISSLRICTNDFVKEH